MQKIILGGTTGLMSLGVSNAAVIHFNFTDVSAQDLGTSLFDGIEHASITFSFVLGVHQVTASKETTITSPSFFGSKFR